MPEFLTYFIMLGFLFTHELDAVRCHEWRMMPLISRLEDKSGEQLFIWTHVPLLVVLFIFGGADPDSILAMCLSGFAVIHVGLHWLFRNHPLNEMNSRQSWALIIGAGVGGVAHLSVSLN